MPPVRKHQAPNGALRLQVVRFIGTGHLVVRKHRAPKGALRHVQLDRLGRLGQVRQKAPGAIRCIKTCLLKLALLLGGARKRRAPIGALRRATRIWVLSHRMGQKAPSTPNFARNSLLSTLSNSQISQNFNDPTSNIETTGRELRATFLRNHPQPAPNGALRRLPTSSGNRTVRNR